MNLADLSNEELLSGVSALIGEGRRLLARLITYLGEVEERRLHLEAAYSSLFDFCVRRFRMSEGEAFRRITAARLARQFPVIVKKIETGEIHLSGLVLLRDHLTNSNHEDLLREASGKTKREVQTFLATRFPKPDVATSIRRLPGADADGEPASISSSETNPSGSRDRAKAVDAAGEQRPLLEALSSTRYRVQFTASEELKDKLAKATELMRHRNPTGDLAVVLERAVDLLIEKLEKERFAKTERPQKKARATSPKSVRAGYIPAAVRREVYERDCGQCTFVDKTGRRCPARAFLEYDHMDPKAHGGTGDAENVRLACRAHNKLYAERVFGREHVERQIHLRREKCGSRVDDVAQGTSDEREWPSAEATQNLAIVEQALKTMGFRDAEARRAAGVVRNRIQTCSIKAVSIQEVLREALAILT